MLLTPNTSVVILAVAVAVCQSRRVAAGTAVIVYIRDSAVGVSRIEVLWIECRLLLRLLDRELVEPSLEKGAEAVTTVTAAANCGSSCYLSLVSLSLLRLRKRRLLCNLLPLLWWRMRKVVVQRRILVLVLLPLAALVEDSSLLQ
jgi:hypothetical protein